MNYVKKEALFDLDGNRVTDFYDEIDCSSEKFYTVKNNGKYNFLNPEGKLLSQKWFTKVNPFGPLDKGVRVEFEGKKCLLTDTGKLIKPRATVRTNLRDGVAIVTNSAGKRNLINTEGKYVSSKWFQALTLSQNDFFEVDITKKKKNIMTKEGNMLLESDADKIRYISTDDNAYYIALCKHGKGPKTIHILDYYTGKEVFSSTVSKEEYTMYTSLGLVLIQNADNKYILLHKEKMRPVFKDWKKDIIILDSFGWFAVKENDNMYVICDQEGKKSLVRRKFIKVKKTYHFNTCYVEYYIKGKVQTGYLDLGSGKIRKNF